ncbi:Hint domain-containing protein [Cypionkella aquatica]|nr:Hint domain-containing protein [Cypionkella aquatica]
MTEQTIHIFAKSAVTITRANGAAPIQGDVIGNALNGDAFSWENPSNLTLTFGAPSTAITFDDANGVLSDDPYSGSNLIDQRLTQPLTINGTTYTPNTETVRWKFPAPVSVENEYEVTLYDSAGTAYRMVGVSITQGYVTTVVGVMFDGVTPPAGTTLTYRQGVSSYSGGGQTVTIPPAVTCFLAGTQIETPTGPRPIETLRIGDPLVTPDGTAPIRWIGRSRVDGRGPLAPIRIAAKALANVRDLYVSPNHRILLRSVAADLYFGTPEVLVAAKFLVNGSTIQPAPMRHAHYFHLMLDTHQMVFSEGIASESLFTGANAMNTLDPAAQAELRAIFPQLDLSRQRLARRSLTRAEVPLILPLRPMHATLRPLRNIHSNRRAA